MSVAMASRSLVSELLSQCHPLTEQAARHRVQRRLRQIPKLIPLDRKIVRRVSVGRNISTHPLDDFDS